jgi:hypothetical protein
MKVGSPARGKGIMRIAAVFFFSWSSSMGNQQTMPRTILLIFTAPKKQKSNKNVLIYLLYNRNAVHIFLTFSPVQVH